uniref:Reverse transcriptase Ty1/copia-type domain-containing protein n=1 Tax=Odontella aurita TaxID=265563 RepID=A0A7S4IN60_9STRA|mmetsp:Transcript_27707/g.81412  ORF Transcript_27707/g.81412 Transcript_27707/m.81412 type:complete len:234 (+) Transcript_27707:1701-2402(+)
MCWYLCNQSHPDIQMAVSQCARFTFCPKRSHEKALKRIGRYLKGFKKKGGRGLILKPSGDLRIDAYVDADFSGLWSYEDPHDPTCVKSRMGYVLCVGNCPVVWMSKLQQEIALSTMEAEYIALSTAMKDIIPLQLLVHEAAVGVDLREEILVSINTRVWEDNQGCLKLARLPPPRMTPRSKHYALKYHWFRAHLRPNQIEIMPIDTNDQLADIFTKALRPEKHLQMRKKLMHW